MTVQTSCPSCGKTGRVPAPYLGKTVGCKRCRTLFKVCTITGAAPERAETTVIHYPENACLEDMPPVMVDIPLPRFEPERVPA